MSTYCTPIEALNSLISKLNKRRTTMAKNNLLKEAIADAKAVRETALANAKIALEEAFTPRIQSMLSAKLAEEEEMDMEDEMAPEMAAEMETPVEDEAPVAAEARMNDEDEDPTDMHSEEMAPEDDTVSEEEDVEPVSEEGRGDDMQEEDLELEAIIKELEEEMESETTDEPVATEGRGDKEVDEAEESDKDDTVAEADEKVADDNIDLDEIISALREEEGDDEKVTEEDDKEEKVTEELEEAYDVIKFLRSKINEVNLLNAKLLFSNKLFRNHSMNENQKMKVIENFDRAANLREVKLVFATLSESFNLNTSRTKRSIKESYASKSSASTAPSKKVISEGNDLAARWKKLANL
jgi:hypothetical protein